MYYKSQVLSVVSDEAIIEMSAIAKAVSAALEAGEIDLPGKVLASLEHEEELLAKEIAHRVEVRGYTNNPSLPMTESMG